VAKLAARQAVTAVLWVRIQTALQNTKDGRHHTKGTRGQHTLGRPKQTLKQQRRNKLSVKSQEK